VLGRTEETAENVGKRHSRKI